MKLFGHFRLDGIGPCFQFLGLCLPVCLAQ